MPLSHAPRDETLFSGLPGIPFSAAITGVVSAAWTVRHGLGCNEPDGNRGAGQMTEPFERQKANRPKVLLVEMERVYGEEPLLHVPCQQN